jgi:hypothetical protein
VSEGSPLENETELLAWAVLRASNRTQARGTTIRLVVPRAQEVIDDLELEGVTEERIVAAEEWLVERDYLTPADAVLTRGTYTITPLGLEWLRGEMPEPLAATQHVTEDAPDDARPSSGGADAPAAPERVPWWRRCSEAKGCPISFLAFSTYSATPSGAGSP